MISDLYNDEGIQLLYWVHCKSKYTLESWFEKMKHTSYDGTYEALLLLEKYFISLNAQQFQPVTKKSK